MRRRVSQTMQQGTPYIMSLPRRLYEMGQLIMGQLIMHHGTYESMWLRLCGLCRIQLEGGSCPGEEVDDYSGDTIYARPS